LFFLFIRVIMDRIISCIFHITSIISWLLILINFFRSRIYWFRLITVLLLIVQNWFTSNIRFLRISSLNNSNLITLILRCFILPLFFRFETFNHWRFLKNIINVITHMVMFLISLIFDFLCRAPFYRSFGVKNWIF